MNLYYMELVPQGIKVYACAMHERHKIWAEHPNAKEISRKQYEMMRLDMEKLKSKQEAAIAPQQIEEPKVNWVRRTIIKIRAFFFRLTQKTQPVI